MKTTRIFLLLVFTVLNFSFCTSRPLKIGIISDIHYLSEQFLDSDSELTESGRNLKETPEILDKVLKEYLNSDIEFLFIAGDITRHGEKQSHIDFVAKLRPLMDKGVRIFVVPGNHDINIPDPKGYQNGNTAAVENISASEFESVYFDCGFSDAIHRDKASLSYVAELDEKNWLLALDGNKYEEYTVTSISSGRIKEQTEQWALAILALAKEKNINVVAMMHHGLVEHFMLQDILFSQYLIDDWQRLANVFADNGVKAVFTGHFHANDITAFDSEKGNTIYDIETGSLSLYPYPYRFAELSEDGINISTENIQSIPSNPDLFESGKNRLKAWSADFAKAKIRERGMNLPDNVMQKLSDLAADVMMEHVKGDETVTEDMQRKIIEISEEMDMPVYMAPDELQLDFPPADNNVEIKFR